MLNGTILFIILYRRGYDSLQSTSIIFTSLQLFSSLYKKVNNKINFGNCFNSDAQPSESTP